MMFPSSTNDDDRPRRTDNNRRIIGSKSSAPADTCVGQVATTGVVERNEATRLPLGASSIDNDEEAEDGSCSDLTSSYDSPEDDILTTSKIQIVHIAGRKRPTGKQAVGPSYCLDKRQRIERDVLDEAIGILFDQEAIDELLQATRPFYQYDTSEKTQEKIVPLLKEAEHDAKEDDERKGSIDESPSPTPDDGDPVRPARPPRCTLNDLRSSQVAHIVEPSLKSTTSFREALAPSNRPRLVTLSLPPFVVVHANEAFSSITGYMSRDVLGLPLVSLLGVEPKPTVTSLDGKLARIEIPDDDDQPIVMEFNVKLSLIGPGPEGSLSKENENEVREDESTGLVTHYGIELVPDDKCGAQPDDAGIIRSPLSSGSCDSSSFRGVLG